MALVGAATAHQREREKLSRASHFRPCSCITSSSGAVRLLLLPMLPTSTFHSIHTHTLSLSPSLDPLFPGSASCHTQCFTYCSPSYLIKAEGNNAPAIYFISPACVPFVVAAHVSIGTKSPTLIRSSRCEGQESRRAVEEKEGR